MSKGPLSGVRVVECCGWHTGPMSATILGDQGADANGSETRVELIRTTVTG